MFSRAARKPEREREREIKREFWEREREMVWRRAGGRGGEVLSANIFRVAARSLHVPRPGGMRRQRAAARGYRVKGWQGRARALTLPTPAAGPRGHRSPSSAHVIPPTPPPSPRPGPTAIQPCDFCRPPSPPTKLSSLQLLSLQRGGGARCGREKEGEKNVA